MNFTIKEPIFSSVVHVFVGETMDVVNKHVRKYYPKLPNLEKSYSANATVFLVEGAQTIYAVFYNKVKHSNVDDVASIAHECVHCAQHVFKVIDASMNDEPFNYYVEFLTRSILEELKKRGYKKSAKKRNIRDTRTV